VRRENAICITNGRRGFGDRLKIFSKRHKGQAKKKGVQGSRKAAKTCVTHGVKGGEGGC